MPVRVQGSPVQHVRYAAGNGRRVERGRRATSAKLASRRQHHIGHPENRPDPQPDPNAPSKPRIFLGQLPRPPEDGRKHGRDDDHPINHGQPQMKPPFFHHKCRKGSDEHEASAARQDADQVLSAHIGCLAFHSSFPRVCPPLARPACPPGRQPTRCRPAVRIAAAYAVRLFPNAKEYPGMVFPKVEYHKRHRLKPHLLVIHDAKRGQYAPFPQYHFLIVRNEGGIPLGIRRLYRFDVIQVCIMFFLRQRTWEIGFRL